MGGGRRGVSGGMNKNAQNAQSFGASMGRGGATLIFPLNFDSIFRTGRSTEDATGGAFSCQDGFSRQWGALCPLYQEAGRYSRSCDDSLPLKLRCVSISP